MMMMTTTMTDVACALSRWQHFSMWNDVIAAILNVWRHIKIELRQSIPIYLKNNPSSRSDARWRQEITS